VIACRSLTYRRKRWVCGSAESNEASYVVSVSLLDTDVDVIEEGIVEGVGCGGV
jgi:hypothetical protein